MQKEFTLKVEYGRSGLSKTFTHRTKSEAEIKLLEYFLENYDESLAEYADNPELVNNNKKDKLIETVDTLRNLAYAVVESSKGSDKYWYNVVINKTPIDKAVNNIDRYDSKLCSILNSIIEYMSMQFHWELFNDSIDLIGRPVEHSIKDISKQLEITKDEVDKIVRDKFNIKSDVEIKII